MNIADDLRYAWRSLSKSPAFAAVAILTLALGIGANSAIFSIVNGVLLKPLDLPEPDRLVFIYGELRQRGTDYFPYSPPDWDRLNREMDLLEGVAAIAAFSNTLTGNEGEGEQVQVAGVTHNFFDLLGAGPFIGRGFTAEDGTFNSAEVPEGTPFPLNTFVPADTAIISHALWQRRFGGDPQAIGREIAVGGSPATIVGVIPDDFRFEMPLQAGRTADVDVWQPLRVDLVNTPRNNVFLNAFGRLKPGVSLEQAQQQLDAWDVRMKELYDINRTAGWFNHYSDFQSAVTAQVRPSVLILMVAVTFVLLIACANVANLLLVRASTRARETAIRAAVGGSQRRLLRQLMIEAGMLAFAGAALGLLLARGGIALLRVIGPPDLPRAHEVGLDLNVVLFTLAIAGAATLLASIVPALRASRPDLINQLRERSSASRSAGGRIFRDSMVVIEVTLSFVLLVGAGLMVRSFVALQNTDPGYTPEGVMTFNLNLPQNEYPQAPEQIRFLDEFAERARGLPGVASVGAVGPLPLSGQAFNGRYAIEENAADAEAFRQADYRFVKGDYFAAMRTPLIAGRLLDRNDELNALPNVVIDEEMVRKAFGGENPLGRKLMIRLLTPEPVLVDVVGVVGHQHTDRIQEKGPEQIYLTAEFSQAPPFLVWTLRSTGDPQLLVGPVKDLVRQMDPNVIVTQIRPLTQLVAESQAPTWFALSLISLFGVIALILAIIGLYSVLSYLVRLRQNELGVRIAFGASPASIFRLIVSRGLALTALGALIGAAIGLSVTRLMQSLLVGVAPDDPATFAAIVVIFLGVAFLAAFLPARRATRVDPVVSLRCE